MTKLDSIIEKQKANGTYHSNAAQMGRRELMVSGQADEEAEATEEQAEPVNLGTFDRSPVLPEIGVPLSAVGVLPVVESEKETATKAAFAPEKPVQKIIK